jgi:hypothetical protein
MLATFTTAEIIIVSSANSEAERIRVGSLWLGRQATGQNLGYQKGAPDHVVDPCVRDHLEAVLPK